MLFSDVTCSWNKEGVSSSLLLLFALLTHQPSSLIFNSSSEPGFVEDDIKMIVLQAWMFHAWYYLTEINCCNSIYRAFIRRCTLSLSALVSSKVLRAVSSAFACRDQSHLSATERTSGFLFGKSASPRSFVMCGSVREHLYLGECCRFKLRVRWLTLRSLSLVLPN